jgi:hypothetical protein
MTLARSMINNNESKNRIIALAGDRATEFDDTLLDLQKAGITLSDNLMYKALIAFKGGYSSKKIVHAFSDGERNDTLHRLFILQEEFKNGSLIMLFPDVIHQVISSYFHSSGIHKNDSLIRAGQLAEKLKMSFKWLTQRKKINARNCYALEQCQEATHLEVLHGIIAHSSINAELFTNRPDLFLKLMISVEQHYEGIVIMMLLSQVTYATLMQKDIRTAIADGLKTLSSKAT